MPLRAARRSVRASSPTYRGACTAMQVSGPGLRPGPGASLHQLPCNALPQLLAPRCGVRGQGLAILSTLFPLSSSDVSSCIEPSLLLKSFFEESLAPSAEEYVHAGFSVRGRVCRALDTAQASAS
uniref:Iroquois homeobox 2 n=1 Tax=Rousettus aegyptiacus TaxID=9407 RepID=A0A7J8F0K6_ROUAE|nr:iroquois homeobox 2 [Rousettus aegyptiacus]